MNQTLSEPYTVLDNRILWYDGDSSYTVRALANAILSGNTEWNKLYVIDEDDFSVRRYNELSGNHILKEKSDLNIEDNIFNWNIPAKYKQMNIKKFIFIKLKNEFIEFNFSEKEEEERINRVLMELNLWEQNDKLDLLRVIIYIIDTFEHNNIVWGTGRGSSCCSYILYLLGLHDVDSVKYDLDITDFFRL